MKVHILIGPAGVGKSTFIQENAGDALVLSSDAIREELYGSLSEGNKHNNEVFQTLLERLREAVEQGDKDVYFDATNLSRKTRTHYYNQIKSWNKDTDVVADILHKPLKTILAQNAQRKGDKFVPVDVVDRMYKSMTIPRIGLDCDEITVTAPDWTEYRAEISHRLDEAHNSPYHAESLREHILMTVEYAKQSEHPERDTLVEIAKHHDLGKAVCRSAKATNNMASRYIHSIYGEHDRYMLHENVGAVYYLVKNKNNLTPEVLDVAESIQQHMQAHDGFSQKVIQRNKLSQRVLDLATAFAEIDSQSRVFDQDIFDKYDYYAHLPKDSLLRDYASRVGVETVINSDFDRDLHTIKYLHGGVDFTDPLLRNARGLTIDSEDNIITIGFEKFFNYKQLETHVRIDDDGVEHMRFTPEFLEVFNDTHVSGKMEVYEKLDGTFLTVGVKDDEFVVATSSSTKISYSPKTVEWLKSLPNSEEIKNFIVDNNMSLMFEYTSPNNRIVVKYDTPSYTLIGARRRDFGSDNENYQSLQKIAQKLSLELVDAKYMTLDELIEFQQTNQDSEGFVTVNEHGKLLKFKTNYWYEEKYRLGDMFFGDPLVSKRLRRYSEMFVNDEFDDFFAMCNQFNDGHYNNQHQVDILYERLNKWVDDSYKDIAKYGNMEPDEIEAMDISKLRKAVIFAPDDFHKRERIVRKKVYEIAEDIRAEELRTNTEKEKQLQDILDSIHEVDDLIL